LDKVCLSLSLSFLLFLLFPLVIALLLQLFPAPVGALKTNESDRDVDASPDHENDDVHYFDSILYITTVAAVAAVALAV